jgi:hypothetical protein
MYLWTSPLQITICGGLLLKVAGIPGMAGLLVMILMVPTSGLLSKIIAHLQRKLMKKQDARVSSINEV